MKKERTRALTAYQEARQLYDRLHAINPHHELIAYAVREDTGLLINAEFARAFHKKFAPDRHLPFAQFMQARWHGYTVALQRAIEEHKRNR